MNSYPQHCSGCGQSLVIKSSSTSLVVCSSCRKIEIKEGSHLNIITKNGKYQEDMSVLQIGTEGTIHHRSFKIIGRVQLIFQQGYRNLWFLLYSHGETGWLGDWEGGYCLLTYHKLQERTGLLNAKAGKEVSLLNSHYQLRRSSKTKNIFIEGELPQITLPHFNFFTCELGDAVEGVAFIHQFSAREADAFVGNFEEFASFSFTKTRLHHKINSSQEQNLSTLSAATQCPECRKALPKFIFSQAHVVGCANCMKLFFQEQDVLSYEATCHPNSKKSPWIPVGKRGKLKGKSYTVVGFMFCKEKNKTYKWSEYILFNPIYGYAFLNEYEGHWNLQHYAADLKHQAIHEDSIAYKGRTYQLFNKYKAQVLYAEGEFPWNILNDNARYTEYIAPPFGFTKSVSNEEISYLHSEYLEPEEISSAFGITEPAPVKVGTGATEPFSQAIPLHKVIWSSVITLALLITLHIFFIGNSKKNLLLKEQFKLSPTSADTQISPISTPLTIAPDGFGTTNLKFKMTAHVNNSWFATGITLINQANGQEYNFDIGVEYYHGYTDGERWTEGSTTEDKIISALPPGSYHMLIYPFLPTYGKVGSFELMVEQDVAVASNFWILLLLITVFPIVQCIRKYLFEQSRWMNSDYSPS